MAGNLHTLSTKCVLNYGIVIFIDNIAIKKLLVAKMAKFVSNMTERFLIMSIKCVLNKKY